MYRADSIDNYQITTQNVQSVKSRIKYFFLGYPCLFQYAKASKEHIMPVNIGMFLYWFDKCNIQLFDVVSVGPRQSLMSNTMLSIVNFFTNLRNNIFENKDTKGADYYLFRLSKDQLAELTSDICLIIVGVKMALSEWNLDSHFGDRKSI